MAKPPKDQQAGQPERGLGRGLAALLGEANWKDPSLAETGGSTSAGAAAAGGARQMPIEFLVANPKQPRRNFPQEDLRQLADSIKQRGLLQPILVRPAHQRPGRFEIVAGERRWRAAQICGLHQVPVIERDLTDAEALECAIIENIQRSDLDPMEEAQGYVQLMERFSHSQEDLARTVSKSRAHVANMLRLLKLPDAVQSELSQGRISIGHARAIVGHDNAESIAKETIAKGLTVRQVEQLILQGKGKFATRRRKITGATGGSTGGGKGKKPDLLRMEKDLSNRLGMRVSIEASSSERGRISVAYQSLEQFEDLRARLIAPPPKRKSRKR